MNEKLIEKLKDVMDNHALVLSMVKHSEEILKSIIDEFETKEEKEVETKKEVIEANGEVIEANSEVTEANGEVAEANGEVAEVEEEVENPQETVEENVRLLSDLDDGKWPLAVIESAIVKNDRDKWVRSNLIASNYVNAEEPILDYGCGEGHLTIVLNNMDKLTYGYDIANHECWSSFKSSHKYQSSDNKFIDYDVVRGMKFKSIIMHDVIDHVIGCSAKELIESVHGLLEDDGKLYVSTHPFSSINGGHLYEEDNRAFLHLLLDDEQLEKFDKYLPNIKITRPQSQYNKIFDGKFKIEHKELITGKLDKWVLDNIFDKICDRWYETIQKEQVKKILEIIKINYTLTKM